ncbi:2 TM domain-containing transmembrane protein, partial [Acrasis kona]
NDQKYLTTLTSFLLSSKSKHGYDHNDTSVKNILNVLQFLHHDNQKNDKKSKPSKRKDIILGQQKMLDRLEASLFSHESPSSQDLFKFSVSLASSMTIVVTCLRQLSTDSSHHDIIQEEKDRLIRHQQFFENHLKNKINDNVLVKEHSNPKESLVKRTGKSLFESAKSETLERTFDMLTFLSINFFVTLFGSKLGPIMSVKVLKNIQQSPSFSKLLKKFSFVNKFQSDARNIEFAGFVIGSVFGASMSTLPNFLVRKLQTRTSNALLRRAPKSIITFDKRAFMSQNLHLMFGALVGIMMNLAIRHGAHLSFVSIATKIIKDKFGSGDNAGSDMMTKMLIDNMMKLYMSFASGFLTPTLPSDPPLTGQGLNVSGAKDNLLRLATSHLEVDNPVAKSLLSWYMSDEPKHDQVHNQVKVLANWYDNVWDKAENTIKPILTKCYPYENFGWHVWSTRAAMIFANRFGVDYPVKVGRDSNHELDQELLKYVRRCIDGNQTGIIVSKL